LLFQHDDINVPSAVTILQGVDITLNDMINNPGPQLLQFDNDVVDNKIHDTNLRNVIARPVFDEQRKQIIRSVLDCIQTRFQNLHDDDLFRACHIFDHKKWPDLNAGNGKLVPNYLYQYTFNNISVISWQSVLLVEEIGENHTLSHFFFFV